MEGKEGEEERKASVGEVFRIWTEMILDETPAEGSECQQAEFSAYRQNYS